jgi:hypothetical protein
MSTILFTTFVAEEIEVMALNIFKTIKSRAGCGYVNLEMIGTESKVG